MRQTLGSVVLGLACFAIVWSCVGHGATGASLWSMWMATTAIASALGGYWWPAHPFRSVLLILLTQPLCLFAALAAAGQIHHPRNSTLGLTTVAITAELLLFWSPIPTLFAAVPARRRQRADALAEAGRP